MWKSRGHVVMERAVSGEFSVATHTSFGAYVTGLQEVAEGKSTTIITSNPMPPTLPQSTESTAMKAS